MLQTALVEDLNSVACAAVQERLASEPAREALERLRWIDTTEIERYRREGWLDAREIDLIDRFCAFARERLGPIPASVDAVEFTRADTGWSAVREQALELVMALDAFIDVGVPGWGQQHRSADWSLGSREGSS